MAVNGKNEKMKSSSPNFIVKAFKGLKAEVGRISWASKKDLKKALAVVTVFCGAYMIYIALLDYGSDNLFKLIFK